MSEIVGRSIADLEIRLSQFGKEDRSEEEVAKFKKSLKKDLEIVRQDLIGLLREFQEKIPSDLLWAKRKLFHFSGYGLDCILTKYGVEDVRHPYNFETVEYIVNSYMYPDLKKYQNEHHPSLAGAKFLWEKIAEIEMQIGTKLEGKYTMNTK